MLKPRLRKCRGSSDHSTDTAVIASHPMDTASAQFDLAQAYFGAGQNDMAEEHLLAALEAAPGYRPAQKLLLEIKDAEKGQ